MRRILIVTNDVVSEILFRYVYETNHLKGTLLRAKKK